MKKLDYLITDTKTKNADSRKWVPKYKSFHDIAIQRLLQENPKLQTENFWPTLKKWLDEKGFSTTFFPEDFFVPDLYELDSRKKCVTIYEVEDTHPLTMEKMAKINNLYDFLDDEAYDLRLRIFNRYGEKVAEPDIDFYAHLMSQGKYSE